VLGHSFGGRVAVCLAARRPELVSGLVLTGVPLLRLAATPRPALTYRLARAANRAGLLSDKRMDKLRDSRGSADYRAATGMMRDILVKSVNETYDTELRAIRCPVRLVWGERDTAAPHGSVGAGDAPKPGKSNDNAGHARTADARS
jgi:pimeloyl-ACP methyl ester carboxylesterase